MNIVAYTPDDFPRIARVAARAPGARSLRHRLFVDHYYASRDWCRLYLAVDADGEIGAVMGLEQIPFVYEGRAVTLGCASNFAALRSGCGGSLFLHWVRSSELACVFGGSPDTHRLVQSQRWTYFPGIRIWRLNRPYAARSDEPGWRKTVKALAELVRPGVDIARRTAGNTGDVRVVEEAAASTDMLPERSPFRMRMFPSVDYLRWRYDGTLSFVRYRWFRIVTDRTRGYVVVNDRPDAITVAQADADDPDTLAAGMLAAVCEVAGEQGRRREVVIASAHPVMQARLTRAGFRADAEDRPFALGAVRRRVEWASDTSGWLVNLDWIDNGMRTPFLDETAAHSS